jgi:putative PIN family toxin of toxin-antitoxin system
VRIVIDTNVLLSGLLWNGAPHTLLNLVRDETVELVMSHALLDEFAEVIQRKKFASILQRTARTHERILQELYILADMVVPQPLPIPVCRDPDDDAVLACAIAANAELIVSGDDDLLTLLAFNRIPILNAAQALQWINTGFSN